MVPSINGIQRKRYPVVQNQPHTQHQSVRNSRSRVLNFLQGDFGLVRESSSAGPVRRAQFGGPSWLGKTLFQANGSWYVWYLSGSPPLTSLGPAVGALRYLLAFVFRRARMRRLRLLNFLGILLFTRNLPCLGC